MGAEEDNFCKGNEYKVTDEFKECRINRYNPANLKSNGVFINGQNGETRSP